MKSNNGPPFPGGNTTGPVIGAVALLIVWLAYSAFFLFHFISESLS